MNRDPEISSAGDLLAEATRGHLHGWRIPDEIPLNPDTAIIPLRPDPDMVRTASRVLHTLLVRTCPDSVIVIGTRTVGGPKPAIAEMGALTTALGEVEIDRGRAARLHAHQRDAIEVFPAPKITALAPESGFETIPILLQVLAPGCRILPILLPAEKSEQTASSPDSFGRLLAELFEKDNVVVVAALELASAEEGPSGTPPPREQLRVRDAELLRHLLNLDLAETARVAEGGAVSSPNVLAAALSHAHARGASQGHLIEYVRSGGPQKGDPWTGRAGIIF